MTEKDIEEMIEVLRYIRAVLPPDRWADDARRMIDAVLMKSKPPVRSGGTKKCTVPENKECHAQYNGMCMNAYLCEVEVKQ